MFPVIENDENEPAEQSWAERAWWGGLGVIAIPCLSLLLLQLVWKAVQP